MHERTSFRPRCVAA